MKYIKTYEKKVKHIQIVGEPEGYIINVDQDEFDELRKIFDISWDDELDYDNPDYGGQWGYDYEEDNDAIEEWLKNYREIVKKVGKKGYKNMNKYNI